MSSQKLNLLTEDSINPSDQKFVCVSFLTNRKEDEKVTSLSAFKVRGCFSTYEEACAHAKQLQQVDELFHVFVGEVGKWLPFDPNPDSESVKNSEYANDQLNQMMKAYMENQEKAKLYHEHRKNEMVKKNLLDSISERHNNLRDVKKKMKKTSDEVEKNKLETSIKSIEEQIKKMETKKYDVENSIALLEKELEMHKPPQPKMPKIITPETAPY
jgi:hypothetical protein